ncbi:hypothetical protein HYH03_008156 [Edaphochlamys debaryana]|uniref:Right handed beta helix domain-containing protein n=1 Tax=Edaphochlamys debaryana TaxID=47281 RepID=A0A835Y9S3_9CHLO|nr:hypothetical protein HYH03_008156 [Edaphochlamys debaryana]|eukprot:KAG2493639.1 hypothetical protein HYH03_008156 [Edaphochlamys debaryana]
MSAAPADMSGLLGQAWEAYEAQRREAPASLSSTLEDLLFKIAQMESPTPEDEEARLDILGDLAARFAELGGSLGGSLSVEAHGAFVMGCFTAASPLEVAVTGKLPSGPQGGAETDVEMRAAADRLSLLEKVHVLVRDSGMAAQGTVSMNRTARVPSVSFEHAGSGVPVRICVAYPGFALRAHVVRGLVQMEPRLRALVQLVELWAEARGLNNPAAGTFNSWALMNLAIFAAQTFQPQPLLPPLWRVCGVSETPAAGATLPSGAPPAAGSNPSAPSASAAAAAAGPALNSSGSNGGAAPVMVRPMQHHAFLGKQCSESLAPALREILARLSGPAEALRLPGAGSCAGPSLLPLFHWCLVLLDRLMAAWQLSWNRRWRVSTWAGALVQQPFNRAFLVPIECPFDAADNVAKSLGCENQPRHQEAFRAVVAEVAASLRLLQATRAPEDLDRAMLGLFGLEVEHLYLEEEEPELEEQPAGSGSPGQPTASSPEQAAQAPSVKATPRPSPGRLSPVASGAVAVDSPIAEVRARLLQADELPPPQPLCSLQPSLSGGVRTEWHPLAPGPPPPTAEAAPRGSAGGAGPAPGAEPSMLDLMVTEEEDGVMVEVSTEDERSGKAGQADMAGVAGGDGSPPRPGVSLAAQATPQPQGTPPLPMSSVAGAGAGSGTPSAMALRANALVQRPLSPLLRDVTNGILQRGSQTEPKPSASSSVTDGSVLETPAQEGFGGWGEGIFGTLLQGARKLFDNIQQGVAELSEDLNELAVTTVSTIRAVINDDEDLPFLGASSRRLRRHRLQLLHRQPGGVANGGVAKSPADGSTASRQRSPHGSVASRSPGGRMAASPGPGGKVVKGTPKTPGGRAEAAGTPGGREWILPASRNRDGGAGAEVNPTPTKATPTQVGASTTPAAAAAAAPAASAPAGEEALVVVSAAEAATAQAPEASAAVAVGHAGAAQAPADTAPAPQATSTEPTEASAASKAPAQALPEPEVGFAPVSTAVPEPPAGPVPAAVDPLGGVTVSCYVPAAGDRGAAVASPSIAPSGATSEAEACSTEPSGTAVPAAAEPCVLDAPRVSIGGAIAPVESSSEQPSAAAPSAPETVPGEAAGAVEEEAGVVLRAGSFSGAPIHTGGSSVCSAAPTDEPTASTVSSPTASTRSFTPTRKAPSGPGTSQPPVSLQPPPLQHASSGGAVPGLAPRAPSFSGGGSAPKAPPPLPPPPPPPAGLGGLRVKSAAFRKGAARDALAPPSAPTAASPAPTKAGPAASASATSPAPARDPRNLVCLSSGRLQELAEAVDRAGPATTIDLQGGVFSGALAAPTMKVTAAGVWITNGELVLAAEQQLVVSAKDVRLEGLTIRDAGASTPTAAPTSTSAGGAGPGPAPAGASRPAVQCTKQSYAGGGGLTLSACRVQLGPSRALGLQVKGKGCSLHLDRCSVSGTSQAAVQASDAALTLTGCDLEAGAGQGVCCRDNATAALTDCRLSAFGGACAAVLAGGSLELSACTMRGSSLEAPTPATDGTEPSQAGPEEAAAATQGPAAAAAAGGGVGLLAEGKVSSVTARGSSWAAFRGQAALVVTAGAAATLEDCKASDCKQGAMVGVRGGRLLATRCELWGHSGEGLLIGEGATADLKNCRMTANGGPGLRVGGVGSMAVMRACELGSNGCDGVAVEAGGCANLDTCTVAANGARHEVPGPPGHGLRVEGLGARASVRGCTFAANAGAGVAASAHGAVQMVGCSIDSGAGAEGAGAQDGPAVAVDVGTHGRVVMSGGCKVGGQLVTPGETGAGGKGLRVAALGALEVLG